MSSYGKNSDLESQVIALAGCCQAAGMVYQLSQKGFIEESLIQTALDAVLNLEPENTLQVFGDLDNIQPGLRLLTDQLFPQGKRNIEIGRYIANLVSLQGQLSRSPDLISTIRIRINQINRQKDLLGKDQNSIIKSVASLYQDTISSLPLRIQVNGQARFLQKEDIQNQVRTALLFGLRCAMLWRQTGGKKRDFLFRRKALANQVKMLIKG